MRLLLVILLITGFAFAKAQSPLIAALEKKASLQRTNGLATSAASGNYRVHYYQLYWQVNPAVNYITGKVTAHFIITRQSSTIVFDLTNSLTVDSVVMHHARLGFSQGPDESLAIQLSRGFKQDERDSVTIYYQGVPPADNQAFVQSYHNGNPIIWTFSDPYGAKDWWPCRNGLDDKADSIDVYITHPAQYKATSNGVLQSETTVNNLTTAFYKHRYPIASYLVAMAVTNYKVFTSQVQLGNKSLPLVTYVYPESEGSFRANTYLVINALKLYNSVFGDYPFMKEQYGQTQFGWSGGMEHQTNSFIVDAGEDLMAHELAHQWFGDKITCASWHEIWLNEGFATYLADILYTEKSDIAWYKPYVQYHLANIVAEPGGSVWVDDTTNVNRIFDYRLTYEKGAFLVRMLRWTLGDSAFFNGLRNYLNDAALQYSFANIAALQKHLEATSNTSLDYFFKQWFYGQGYPSFKVGWQQNTNNYAHVTIGQTTSHISVPFFKVPLALTFKNSTQSKTIVVNDTVNNQEAWLDVGFAADTVLIDPDMQLISNNNVAVKLTDNINTTIDVVVYPNPFKNIITLAVKNPQGKSLQVALFSAAGKKVFTNEYKMLGADVVLQIQLPLYLPPGVYFLKLEGENIHLVKKLQKG
jgi:aminopeptidase N